MHSQLLEIFKCESKWKTTEEGRIGARSLTHNTLRGRGACWSFEMGLGRVDKLHSLTHACTKPTQGGQCVVGALLVLGWTTSNMDTQDSPRPGLEGSHHLPPYSIFCTSPRGPHPNGFWSQDSQVEVSKSPKLGLSRLWGAITLRADLGLRWGLKQSCNPHQDISNIMSHAICTHGNLVDSRLLVVGSQIANLTPDPSFDHNLCFRYRNEQCEPILDIYVPRSFQWYK
jgi:hypothetical protein